MQTLPPQRNDGISMRSIAMSTDTKSPAPETAEPQKITPQTGELDAEKLDEVAGGGGSAGTVAVPHAPPPPSP
jgi:hypothetical protein